MHKLILYIFAISIFTSCKNTDSRHSNDIFNAFVAFKDTTYDFSTSSHDSKIKSYKFEYTNIGDVPAVILNVTPSCKCTSAEYTKEPVMPGKKGKVIITYDGKNDNAGYFDKSVSVRFNSKVKYVLKIRGTNK